MTAYANSPSSPGQEEASLAVSSSDGSASVQSSGNPTPLLYLPPDRMRAFSRLSRYGMTFKPLTDDHGEALLTWYREAFLVKTSAPQERGQASPESAAGCGPTWHGSLAKFDPDTRSWRTAQHSLLGGLTLFSGTWPRWGTMRNGECSESMMPVGLADEKDFGLWPAPTKMDSFTNLEGAQWSGAAPYTNGIKRNTDLAAYLKHLGRHDLSKLTPFREWLMGFPPGWTMLIPQSEMHKVRQWCASHGIPFTND